MLPKTAYLDFAQRGESFHKSSRKTTILSRLNDGDWGREDQDDHVHPRDKYAGCLERIRCRVWCTQALFVGIDESAFVAFTAPDMELRGAIAHCKSRYESLVGGEGRGNTVTVDAVVNGRSIIHGSGTQAFQHSAMASMLQLLKTMNRQGDTLHGPLIVIEPACGFGQARQRVSSSMHALTTCFVGVVSLPSLVAVSFEMRGSSCMVAAIEGQHWWCSVVGSDYQNIPATYRGFNPRLRNATSLRASVAMKHHAPNGDGADALLNWEEFAAGLAESADVYHLMFPQDTTPVLSRLIMMGATGKYHAKVEQLLVSLNKRGAHILHRHEDLVLIAFRGLQYLQRNFNWVPNVL